ncbi:hypothetical protein SAMN05444272_4245 [Roseibium suaedae]|uniref:Uncharacterized protein n=1 Tax=Roseibium suaedae TaxID=735517 RepID=A0A1M7P9T0_9HYPH|nr:hypothetical protein SAMN05444272_4245 [Roseibium suaedae]
MLRQTGKGSRQGKKFSKGLRRLPALVEARARLHQMTVSCSFLSGIIAGRAKPCPGCHRENAIRSPVGGSCRMGHSAALPHIVLSSCRATWCGQLAGAGFLSFLSDRLFAHIFRRPAADADQTVSARFAGWLSAFPAWIVSSSCPPASGGPSRNLSGPEKPGGPDHCQFVQICCRRVQNLPDHPRSPAQMPAANLKQSGVKRRGGSRPKPADFYRADELSGRCRSPTEKCMKRPPHPRRALQIKVKRS